MPYALLERPCEDCGQPVARRKRADRRYLCIDCAMAASTRAGHELHDREGPAYLRHREGIQRRERRRRNR